MKVLLAVDNSSFADAAVKLLLREFRPETTTVRVLHVVEPLDTPYYPELSDPYPSSLEDIRKSRLAAGKKLARRIADQIKAAGFKTSSTVRVGHARPTIVDVATSWNANLIVLGSHGRSGVKRLLLGSVSEYTARHANCSVMVVRRGRR